MKGFGEALQYGPQQKDPWSKEVRYGDNSYPSPS